MKTLIPTLAAGLTLFSSPLTAAASADSRSDMDNLIGRFVGQYTTGDQAEATHGGFTHVNFIGCAVGSQGFESLGAGTRVLYEERNFEVRPVHYQRVLVLVPRENATIEMRIHQVADKPKFLGLCRSENPGAFVVKPDLLLPSECSQFYTVRYDALGKDIWTGDTPQEGCPSKWFPGSEKMTSHVEIPADRLIRVWGRFYDAQGTQVGGVEDEPYLYLPLQDEKAARGPLENLLKQMVGKWKGTERKFDGNGALISSTSNTEAIAFDGRKFENAGAATSQGTIVSMGAAGGTTPDGRLYSVSRDGMQNVCRLQSADTLACTSWDYLGANNRWKKSLETVTRDANGELRSSNFQEFDGENLVSFGFSEFRREQ
jgi:hypothetical protein